MKKFRLLLISMLLVLAGVIAGCGSDGGDSDLSSVASESSYAVSFVTDNSSYDEVSSYVTDEGASSGSLTSEASEASETSVLASETDESSIAEDGTYTDKDQVALYIHVYGHLPSNYITKSEAKELGWVSNKGNLDEVAPGMSIGGDRFGNREGLLPSKKGRTYTECDINYTGGYRGGERIVFSNDGLVYYSADHYQDFELLYGEE